MKESTLLAHHRAAAARLTAPAAGAPQLLTYGDVPGEYRAGTTGTLLFDETDRGRLTVRGADATAFLHRLLANDVKGLEPGRGNRNLLLSPKGKILHEFELAPMDTRDPRAPTSGDPEPGYTLTTAPGGAAPLAAALDLYLFSDDVRLADATEDYAPLALCGPTAPEILRAVLGVDPPRELHRAAGAEWQGRPVTVVAVPVAGSPGWRVEAEPAAVPELWAALLAAGAKPGGVVVRDALRVEAGQALFGVDVDDSVYPQEARIEDGFSLSKGCYVGQEVVAKIDTYGGLNKCLFGLRVDHDDPVPAGTRLLREVDGERRDLGVCTSWSYSFVLDTGLVLAYVKRKHQAPGTEFELGEGAPPGRATIVDMPVRPDVVPFTGGPKEAGA